MPFDWKSAVETMRSHLEPFIDREYNGDQYFSAIIHIDGEPSEEVDEVVPRVHACGHRVADKVIVPLSDGSHHVHYIFHFSIDDSKHELLTILQREVKSSKRILAALPKKVFPRIEVPQSLPEPKQNLVAWLYLLHWLGKQEYNRSFKTPVEFFDSLEAYGPYSEFKPWEDYSPHPDFEPIALLTLSGDEKENHEYWKEQHQKQNRHMPQIIASSLSKPLLYASINAVDLLFSRASKESGKHVRAAKVTARGETINSEVYGLLLFLMKHHKNESDEINLAPLTMNEIKDAFVSKDKLGNQVKWNDSRLFRRMGAIVAKIPRCKGKAPWEAYEYLCRENLINTELAAMFIREFADKRIREHLLGEYQKTIAQVDEDDDDESN